MIYSILYRPAPLWSVGEGRTDLDSDLATRNGEPMRQPASPDHHYPGDYAGQITSIEPVETGRRFAAVASKHMLYAELELTGDEFTGLASRRMKLSGGKPAEVTFEDRHGVNAAPLIAAATSRTRAEQLERLAENPAEDGMDPDAELFQKQVETLTRLLPQNVAHTGTGLYRAKAAPSDSGGLTIYSVAGQAVEFTTAAGSGGDTDLLRGGYVSNTTRGEVRAIVSYTAGETFTLEGSLASWVTGDTCRVYDSWPTIQAAQDQLYADQGTAEFSSIQRIGVGAGVFNEAVLLTSGLKPMPLYRLLIYGAGTASTTVTNTGLSANTIDPAYVRNTAYGDMTVNCVVASKTGIGILGDGSLLEDLIIAGGGVGQYGIRCAGNTMVRRVGFSGFASYNVYSAAGIFENCTFDGGSIGLHISTAAWVLARGCLFDGCGAGIFTTNTSWTIARFVVLIYNNTFYNNNPAIQSSGALGKNMTWAEAKNNIFLGNTVAWYSADTIARIDSKNNLYYGNTKVASMGGVTYNSLEDWQTFVDEDGISPDADSLAADPLITDAAGGDFSLGTGSPCIHAGIGSGVASGMNAVGFDPYTPDIGAWSSGPAPVTPPVVAASWPSDDSALAAVASRCDAALSWATATAGEYGVMYRVRMSTDGGATWDRECITTDTALTFHGLIPAIREYTFGVAAMTVSPGQAWITAAHNSTATAGESLGRAWPSTLPAILVAGSSETFENLVTRTQMDTGPAQQRRRFSRAPRPISGSIGPLTSAQLAAFDAWYHTTLKGGAEAFVWKHPRTKAECRTRFIGGSPPQVTSRDPERHLVAMELEILP